MLDDVSAGQADQAGTEKKDRSRLEDRAWRGDVDDRALVAAQAVDPILHVVHGEEQDIRSPMRCLHQTIYR